MPIHAYFQLSLKVGRKIRQFTGIEKWHCRFDEKIFHSFFEKFVNILRLFLF